MNRGPPSFVTTAGTTEAASSTSLSRTASLALRLTGFVGLQREIPAGVPLSPPRCRREDSALPNATPPSRNGTVLSTDTGIRRVSGTGIVQVLQYLLHRFRGTPHLCTAGIVPLVVASFSALFNWYAMLRGTLQVGGEGSGSGRDLYCRPLLLLGFLAVLRRRIARAVKSCFSRGRQRGSFAAILSMSSNHTSAIIDTVIGEKLPITRPRPAQGGISSPTKCPAQ